MPQDFIEWVRLAYGGKLADACEQLRRANPDMNDDELLARAMSEARRQIPRLQ